MARKRFGQNFLIDHQVIYAIIEAIDPQPNQHFVEIGPGLGALTKPLIASGAQLDAIEIDRDLIADLQSLDAPNFKLYNADILTFDLHTLGNNTLRLVGNLPYNISTPLLFKIFNDLHLVTDMYFMLQREVAERLVAVPNCKDYGKLSVMAQFYCDMQILMEIPPTAFAPAPKIYSAIVKFTPHAPISVASIKLLQHVVSTAFNQRRKTIANSLQGLLTQPDLLQLGISPTLRAENLTLNDYVILTNYLASKQ